MRKLLVVACIAALAAGCLAPDPRAGALRTQNAGGEMTARESRVDNATLCSGSVFLTMPPRFCATRVVTVAGTISGLTRMDLSVATFNGGVAIHPSAEGQWGFVATLRAQGSSAEDAKAKLDDVDLAWEHVTGGAHFLDARATLKTQGDGGGYSASFDVTMPPSVTYVLTAATTNGKIDITSLKTDGLSLRATNGGIVASAQVTQADLTSTNGDVSASLDPTASGRVTLTTSNGNVDLRVPEDAQHGYDAALTTSNGMVVVQMSDGAKGECPAGSQSYAPPCTHRTFRTTGFDARAIQSLVALATTNGDATLRA